MEYRIASCTFSFVHIIEYQIKVFQVKNKQRLRAKITDDLLILWPGHPGRPDRSWASYTPNTICWFCLDLHPICLPPPQRNDTKVDLKITKNKGKKTTTEERMQNGRKRSFRTRWQRRQRCQWQKEGKDKRKKLISITNCFLSHVLFISIDIIPQKIIQQNKSFWSTFTPSASFLYRSRMTHQEQHPKLKWKRENNRKIKLSHYSAANMYALFTHWLGWDWLLGTYTRCVE